jgi:hypothetical protein
MSQSQPIPVNAVVISGIALPVQSGNAPIYQEFHIQIEKKGNIIEIIANHQSVLNLNNPRPTNHMANGKLKKKPTDTVKCIPPAFSERIPISIKKTSAMKNGVIPIFVGKSVIVLTKANENTNSSSPVRTRPELNMIAAGIPLS